MTGKMGNDGIRAAQRRSFLYFINSARPAPRLEDFFSPNQILTMMRRIRIPLPPKVGKHDGAHAA
jgi:hypothetical protein